MAEGTSNEPLSDVSNNSFVILGSGSYVSGSNDDIIEQKIHLSLNPMHNINSFNGFHTTKVNNSTLDSFSPATEICDMTPQEKLNWLLEENNNLKETLTQNNLAIRTQFSTFSMWQEELLKSHEIQKQKFMETKDLILKLRDENMELKKHLEESSSGISGQSVKKKSNLEQCSECVMKSQEYMRVQGLYDKEVEKNESLILEKIELQKIIDESKEEISKLRKNIIELTDENNSLRQKGYEQTKNVGESFSLSLLPNCEARLQISNLFKQLEEERAKVHSLKEKLQKAKAGNENLGVSNDPTDELTQYISELNAMDESFQKQSQRINGLSSWIHLTEENFLKSNSLTKVDDSKIMSELAKLKSHLSAEENNSKQREVNLQCMHEQYTKLLKDYKELQQQWDNLKTNESSVDELNENVQSLKNEVNAKEEILKAKNEELNTLKETVKKLNLECEEVAILKVQMELYRSDFNEERAAREKLVSEKEEMAEQVRSLQMVIKEMEQQKEQSLNSSSEASDSCSTSSNQTPSPKGKKSRYVCPKCMFSFSDLRTCQEHIEDCVNIHFYP